MKRKPNRGRTKEQLKLIRKWLIDLDMTQEEIGRQCGVRQCTVSYVISGKRRSQAVINFFLAKGCPSEFFECSAE